MTDVNSVPPKSRRRWCQFSLRTLLLFSAIIAVWLSLYSSHARRQRRAAETAVRLGGIVKYQHEADGQSELPGPRWLRSLVGDHVFARIIDVRLDATKTTNRHLANLDGLDTLKTFSLSPMAYTFRGGPSDYRRFASPVTNAGLAHLRKLNNLVDLKLIIDGISDDGLVNLIGLRKLESLSLSSTRITDAGLVHLAPLTNLRSLSLRVTGVKGPGLKHLTAMQELDELSLFGSPVTDDGLEHIAKLSDLDLLNLGETDVTDEGVAKLAGTPELGALNLSGTKVSDACLEYFRSFPSLHIVTLDGCPGITKAAVRRFEESFREERPYFMISR